MDSEKATAVSPSSPLRAPKRTRLAPECGYDSSRTPEQEGSATTRRRSSPAGKRNGGDGPILSPSAAAGSVRARMRTQS